MARFIWFTYGDSAADVRESKAVVVHAASIEEAVDKVVADHDAATDDPECGSYREEYETSWFLQPMSDVELR